MKYITCWTKEKIEEFVKNYIELNGDIKKRDLNNLKKTHNFCSIETVRNRYGSVDNFFKIINKTPKSNVVLTKEIISNKMLKLYKQNGPIFFSDYPHFDKLVKYFRNRQNFEKELGIKCLRIRVIVDKDMVIQVFSKELHNRKFFTKQDVNKIIQKHNLPKVNYIRRECFSMFKLGEIINIKYIPKSIKYTKENILKTLHEYIKIYGIISKSELCDLYNHIDFCTESVLYRLFGNLNNVFKELGIKPKQSMKPIGRNETAILNKIEKQSNIILSRQYKVGIYYVDGYDKENNVVYEVDESHHKYNKIQDIIRENKIKNILDCEVIRINELEFLTKSQTKELGEFI